MRILPKFSRFLPLIAAMAPPVNASDVRYAGGAMASPAGVTGQIKWSVLGTAPGVAYDQANFGDFPGIPIIAATYALATITPSVLYYTNAEIAQTLLANPSQLRNLNVTQADSAATVASIVVRPTRATIYGENATVEIQASGFQTPQDFQATRVQIPMDVVMDGATPVVITNDSNATPASYKITFTFGLGPSRGAEVPNYGPATIRSPGM